MQLHTLQSKTKRQRSRQIGRGGKRGTTAGRGTKGQKARAGHKIRPEIRDMIKKLPKQRGRGKNSNKSIDAKIKTFDLNQLASAFKAGEVVSLKTLKEKKLIAASEREVKLIGNEGLKQALNIKGLKTSAGAKKAIEAAGGKLE